MTGRIEEQEEFSEKSDEIVLDLYAAIGDVSDFQDKLEEHFPDLFPSYYDVVDDIVQRIESGKDFMGLDKITKFVQEKTIPSSSPTAMDSLIGFLEDSEDNYFEEVQAIKAYLMNKRADFVKEQESRNPKEEIEAEIKANVGAIVGSFLEVLEEDLGEQDDFKYFLDFDATDEVLSSNFQYPFIVNFYKGAMNPDLPTLEYQGTPPPEEEEEEYREDIYEILSNQYRKVSKILSDALWEAREIVKKVNDESFVLDDIEGLETQISLLKNYGISTKELETFLDNVVSFT